MYTKVHTRVQGLWVQGVQELGVGVVYGSGFQCVRFGDVGVYGLGTAG